MPRERFYVNINSLIVISEATTTRLTFPKLTVKPAYTVEGIWP